MAWALLRGETDGTEVREIDLLVAPSDAARLDRTLASAGFARIPVWGHAPHRFFVAHEPSADGWVKLDIVTHLEFRAGYRLPDRVTDAVIAGRVETNGVAHLAAADQFWLQLLHCLLDRGAVREADMAQLRGLQRTEVTHGVVYRALDRNRATDDALELVRRGDAAGLRRLAPRLATSLARVSVARRAAHRLARWTTPLMKAVRRPGVTVALLGPDGAGKTTLIQALAGSFYYPTRTYYLGLYGAQRPRLAGLARLPGAELGAQLLRLWRGYLLAAYHRRRGRLVLFDRHGYEALLPTVGRASWKRRLRRVLIGRLSPAPDLAYVLDAPQDVLYARKQEHDLAALTAQRAAYRQLGTWLEQRGRGGFVDAGRDATTVRRQATALIWDHLARRR